MGEKGSIKNRIKDFFKIRKKLLKKKEKEQKLLQEKNKRYTKSKIFFTLVTGYLLNIIVYPFTKKSLNKQVEIKKLNNIEMKLEFVGTIEELRKLEIETNNIKRELNLDKKIDIKLNKKTNDLIKKIDIKKEKIKSQDISKQSVENIKVETELVTPLKNINPELNIIEKKLQNTKDIKEIEKLDKKLDNLKDINKYNLDTQIKLNKLKEQVQILKSQIQANTKENEVVKIEETLEEEKIKEPIIKKVVPALVVTGALGTHLVAKLGKEIIDSIRFKKVDYEKDQLEEINNYEKDNNKLDEKNLEESEEILKENDGLNIISKNKKDDINKIEKDTRELKIKEEQKNINLKNRLEEFYVSIREIKFGHELVEKELEKQKLEIKKIQIKLLKLEPKKRKRSLLNIIGEQTLNFTLTLTPLVLFKNKLVGGIVGSIILNHRVKKARKIIKYDKIQFYYNVQAILKQIIDKKDAIVKMININLDTISEIEELKNDILKEIDNELEKYPEIFNIINILNKNQNKLEEKNERLKKELEKTKELEKKGKVKIKRLQV